MRYLLTAFWIAAAVGVGQVAHAERFGGACRACHEFLGGELARPVVEWA